MLLFGTVPAVTNFPVLSKMLIAKRIGLGMSQELFAQTIGLSLSRIQAIEQSDTGVEHMRLGSLRALSVALQKPLDAVRNELSPPPGWKPPPPKPKTTTLRLPADAVEIARQKAAAAKMTVEDWIISQIIPLAPVHPPTPGKPRPHRSPPG